MVTSHPSVLRETKRHRAGDQVTLFWMKKRLEAAEGPVAINSQ